MIKVLFLSDIKPDTTVHSFCPFSNVDFHKSFHCNPTRRRAPARGLGVELSQVMKWRRHHWLHLLFLLWESLYAAALIWNGLVAFATQRQRRTNALCFHTRLWGILINRSQSELTRWILNSFFPLSLNFFWRFSHASKSQRSSARFSNTQLEQEKIGPDSRFNSK